ncbi:hypothetical protein Nepgr_017423 [Nepenthes gracilis]|uniref:Uncharacterized protein n=1 Tax=Nepenthes gracilis TaxID=150966 RepID=A0AAD3XS54_NEPGR|nr:hypothetical protein Nepgr_017423 [Nepenthes gracilis]
MVDQRWQQRPTTPGYHQQQTKNCSNQHLKEDSATIPAAGLPSSATIRRLQMGADPDQHQAAGHPFQGQQNSSSSKHRNSNTTSLSIHQNHFSSAISSDAKFIAILRLLINWSPISRVAYQTSIHVNSPMAILSNQLTSWSTKGRTSRMVHRTSNSRARNQHHSRSR